MKKLMYIFLILPLIMSGCKGKKEAERGGMPTPEISVAYPLVQNITLTKDYPGYLTTEQTVNLVARVNGALQSASFTPGTRVKQGQLLFVIEPTIYKDNVTQAEAQLKTALAQLEYARNNYSRMKEALKSDAVSVVEAVHIRDREFEPFAFRINEEAMPEPVESYLPKEKKTGRPTKGPFDPDKEIPKNVHRPALDAVFANGNINNYDDYIERLKEGYGLQGIKLGYNKAVKVATLLSDKQMVIKEGKDYAFNPEYHY